MRKTGRGRKNKKIKSLVRRRRNRKRGCGRGTRY